MSPRLRRTAAAAAAVALALASGACSYRLEALDDKAERTASVSPRASAEALAALAEADLVYAKAAATDALARGAKDASLPWENPRTGARGTITPMASTYEQDGATCRDFLASYLRAGSEVWYQGGACRTGRRWEVRGMRVLKRT